jgi:glycosyltransferase involved in cell wall biosynthesis
VIALVVALTTGGTGRHVRAVVDALVAAGEEVVVAGPPASEAAFGFGTVAAYEPVDVGTGPRPADAFAVRRLRRILDGADLVHAHGVRAGALASWAVPSRRPDGAGRTGVSTGPPGPHAAGGVPYVVTWHNAVLGSAVRRRLWAPVERRVARHATVSLCVSADLADRVRALGGRDVRVAPVGARRPGAVRPRADIRAELAAADRPLVVAAGRLAAQKGYDLLVEAARAYELRTPRPRTVIAGDGPLRTQLAEAARAAGVDVTLLGARDDVPDLFAAADVVVLPSRWEGSPLTAHEALFAGAPLVATRVGGLPDLLGDGAARLVDAEDPEAIAAAVTSLLDHPAEAAAQAERGRRRAEEWPDEPEAARRVLAVYRELLAR